MSWTKHLSKRYQKEFWFNQSTGESTWKNPNESTDINIKKKSTLSPEPITDSRKLRNDKLKRLLIEYVRRKKKEESDKKCLEESEKNEKSSNIEDLSNKVENLKIEKKENEKSIVQPEKPKIKPKKSYSSYLDNDSEYKNYEFVNGNGIGLTIRATDKYDAMEQARDVAQSLNPYD